MLKGATLQFTSRKSVLVKNPESLVFVQTDKPIYKPGQTGTGNWAGVDSDNRKPYGLHSPETHTFIKVFRLLHGEELKHSVNLISVS